MTELSLPTKALLLASATLMIGFSTLGRCRGNEKVSACVQTGTELLDNPTYSALNFISWPNSAFTDPTAPFVIGVFGKPLAANEIQINKYVTQPRLVQKRRVKVVEIESVDAISDCQLLFIAQSCGHDQTAAALHKVFGQPVLTVGESEGFATAGGVMNLVRNPSKKRGFELNMRAAERQQLKIDGRLVALASIVDEP